MKRNRYVFFAVSIIASAVVLSACSIDRCKHCGEVVKTTVLRGVHFDFNKATLRPDGYPVLQEDIDMLKADPTLDIMIEGHCDIIGSDAYNQTLSEKRAKSVYDYFIRMGISPYRMRTIGYGKTMPLVPNDSPEHRALNRRIEIKIIKARR